MVKRVPNPKTLEKKRVACYKKVTKLLNHSRNDSISLVRTSEKGAAFSVRDKRGNHHLYTGLTKKLKRLLYPDLEENPWYKERGARQPAHYQPKYKRVCEKFGKDHGTQVHSEIEIFVNEYKRTNTFRSFELRVPHPDPCTSRIIQTCLDKNWYPVSAEFKIYDEDARTATAVDMIVVDQNSWKLVLIEVKTGYEDEVYGPHAQDSKFKRPFEKITNCPLFRHQFQLVSMMIMIQKKYKIAMDDAYLLRSLPKSRTIETISLAKWARNKDYKENLYNLLCSET